MKILTDNSNIILQRLTKSYKSSGFKPWAWEHPTGKPNFGDALFLEIVHKLIGDENEVFDNEAKRIFYPGGSVLHCANEGDIMWGVGLNNPRHHFFKLFPNDIRICGVRGPITQSFIQHSLKREQPPVIGDSAFLIPSLFPEYQRTNKYKMGFIPHYKDATNFKLDYESLLIDPLRKPKEVIHDILSCDFIVSSSLHGIIIAEMYGIPARWLKPERINEPPFKFYDYYLSTKRHPTPASTIEEAIKLGGEEHGNYEFSEKLLKTFPFEFYSNT